MNASARERPSIGEPPSDAELSVREFRRHKLANRVHVIADGEEALDSIFCGGSYRHRSFIRPPKLILLDVKLPKVSGLTILKMAKDDPRTRHTDRDPDLRQRTTGLDRKLPTRCKCFHSKAGGFRRISASDRADWIVLAGNQSFPTARDL